MTMQLLSMYLPHFRVAVPVAQHRLIVSLLHSTYPGGSGIESCTSEHTAHQSMSSDAKPQCHVLLSSVELLQELAALASDNVQVGLAEQLEAAGLNLPSTTGLISARSTSSVGSSRSGSTTPSRATKRVTPQRSMRMSTGSIG